MTVNEQEIEMGTNNRVAQLQETARKAQDELSRIQAADFKAKNGKLVGKTFKVRNNYSCPEKPSDYWNEYAKVTRMDKYGMLYAVVFAIDKNGTARVEPDHCIHHAQYYSPIPAAEFERAKKKTLAKLRALLAA
jgi:hypothetical protein